MQSMTVTTMNWNDWHAAITANPPLPGKPIPPPNGYSPGGAGAKLGITRAAVHMAIRRGTLDAVKIPTLGGEHYWFIPQEALQDYIENHLRFELPE